MPLSQQQGAPTMKKSKISNEDDDVIATNNLVVARRRGTAGSGVGGGVEVNERNFGLNSNNYAGHYKLTKN